MFTQVESCILLISDLEKHTIALQKWGDVYQVAINQMHSRAEELAKACNGSYIKNLGDGFVLMFQNTEFAIDCAIEICKPDMWQQVEICRH